MAKSDKSSWGQSTIDTACPLDCPDTCSLAVSVEKGRVVTIDGSNRHDVTGSFICGKVRRFHERVYGEDRLRSAGIRQGRKGDGHFKNVPFDQALDVVAKKMTEVRDRWGAEAILPFSYGGSNGLVTQDTADAQLFRRFGTSRLARTVCAAPTSAVNVALYGKMAGTTYTDYSHSRLIMLWGVNPSTSGIHLVPHIRAAVKNGAALIVVDPRKTSLAKQADIHLQVKPGTDVAVAMAIHRFLFEHGLADETFLADHTRGASLLRERAAEWTLDRAATVANIDTELLSRVAKMYAETSPAVIRCGWGLERNRNGGNAAMAILALPAVAGKFGVRGGGFSMSNSNAWGLEQETCIGVKQPNTRTVNMIQLGRALTELKNPPIGLLFVYNCNPAVTIPDQNRVLRGLRRDDLFTVVFDQVMTDTARWADVVLPATTFLEHYDIAKSYGTVNLQLVQPIIEPVGDSRPNVEVFADLARRLGIEVSATLGTDPEAVMHVTATMPNAIRESLMQNGSATPPIPVAPVQFVDVFPQTHDGKIDLFPSTLERDAPLGLYTYRGDLPADTYPLMLLSPASEKTINSTLGELRPRLASLQIHPTDAEARGLNSGDIARVFNQLGEIHCPITVNPDMKSGTVGLPKGLWRKSTMNGSTANSLVSDSLTDLGGGACFNDARVEVTRIVTGELEGHSISLWTASTLSSSNKIHSSKEGVGSN